MWPPQPIYGGIDHKNEYIHMTKHKHITPLFDSLLVFGKWHVITTHLSTDSTAKVLIDTKPERPPQNANNRQPETIMEI